MINPETKERINFLEKKSIESWEQKKYEQVIELCSELQHIASYISGNNPEFALKLTAFSSSGLAESYRAKYQYLTAKFYYQKVLEIDRKLLGDDHLQVAISLNGLANLYQDMGQYEDEEALLKQVLNIRLKNQGDDHFDVAKSLYTLAQLYRSTGKYQDAELFYQKALDIYRKAQVNEDPDVSTILNGLAGLYQAIGKYEEAENLYQEALDIDAKTLGEADPKFATSLNGLAGLYQAIGKYEEAENLYQEALDIDAETLGEADPKFATSLNNLAWLYQEIGKYKEAEILFQRAIKIKERLPNKETVSLAATLNNLAWMYYKTGNYCKSELHHQKALKIRYKLLDEKHPDIATSHHNLGALYQAIGKYNIAEYHYQKSLEIALAVLGEAHPDIATAYHNLGTLYQAMGGYNVADSYYKKALTIDLKTLGEKHPKVAHDLHSLAYMYQVTRNYAEAEIRYLKSLEIRCDTLGQEHPDVASSLNNLAVLYCLMGRDSEAELAYKKSLYINTKLFGKNHRTVADIHHNLGALYYVQDNYKQATTHYNLAYELSRDIFGEQHPDVASTLTGLAETYHASGHYRKAYRCCSKALKYRLKTMGSNHPEVATNLQQIALLSISLGNKEKAVDNFCKAIEIRDWVIGEVFSFSSEMTRMAYVQKEKRTHSLFLSFLLQYFPDDCLKIQLGLNLLLRRKSVGAESLAIQLNALWTNRYPNLEAKFSALIDLTKQISQKIIDGPRFQDNQSYQQHLAEWQQQKEQLESALVRQIPEMNLAKKIQLADCNNVASSLPTNSVLVEFVYFHNYSFKAVPARGEKQWEPSRYVAFVLHAGEPEQIRLINLGEAEPINQMIKTFRTLITREQEESNRTLVNDAQEAAKRLARPETPVSSPLVDNGHELRAKIFDPLLPAIGNCKRLFIAPDGDLSRLPFEVLPTDDGHRLIDHYTISYLSTGRDVLRFGAPSTGEPTPPIVAADPDFDLEGSAPITEPSPEPEDPTAIGNSDRSISHSRISRDFDRGIHFGRLQGTRTEGERIAQLLGVNPLLGAEVRETPLKACQSPQILHIATHGFFLENQKQDPNEDKLGAMGLMDISPEGSIGRLSAAHIENPLLRSGLALAGANTWLKDGTIPEDAEDAILTAEDVTAMDLLSTEMVVLSACETGLGEVQTGEGVFGLRRSFILAGAKTLVMSLWKVPDKQTQELMEDFYKRILAGQPRAEALRGAQLEMKRKYPDPLYWGAFICQGDPGPLKTYLYQHST
ncbi:CHAT domain-containing tetratricopeptide repeat protein [Nodosilinea sp. AN01ver1]|uniref:CHAT domain-containing tetratricopeptide repeat protein n=1 Tax=Nodosilinea sp. AN01ver1 TaxID=3423362 RepID=UPI003D3122EB